MYCRKKEQRDVTENAVANVQIPAEGVTGRDHLGKIGERRMFRNVHGLDVMPFDIDEKTCSSCKINVVFHRGRYFSRTFV